MFSHNFKIEIKYIFTNKLFYCCEKLIDDESSMMSLPQIVTCPSKYLLNDVMFLTFR
jgi:hypothetical protein